MSTILSPHTTEEQIKADQSVVTLLLTMLKMELFPQAEQFVKLSEQLNQDLRLMYLDGATDVFENWAKFSKTKYQFMLQAQELVTQFNQWESKFIEWQKNLHGEEAVKTKLAQAMKGL